MTVQGWKTMLKWSTVKQSKYASKLTDWCKFKCCLYVVVVWILRIVEFNLKLLDCSKKPTIWTWVEKPLQPAKFQ